MYLGIYIYIPMIIEPVMIDKVIVDFDNTEPSYRL